MSTIFKEVFDQVRLPKPDIANLLGVDVATLDEWLSEGTAPVAASIILIMLVDGLVDMAAVEAASDAAKDQ